MTTHRWARVLAICVLLATAAHAPAQTPAQTPTQPTKPAARGTIDGVVVDEAMEPVANATISIMGVGNDIITTGANGRFRITDLAAGEFLLTIRRLTYRPLISTVRVAAQDTIRPFFTLSSASVSLDPVVVTDNAVASSLDEFYKREHAGVGQFMEASKIRELNIPALSGVMRTFTGVTIFGTAWSKRMAPAKSCPMQFVVDRVAIPTPKDMDLELPAVTEIAGIEVYSGPATVPPQYAGLSNAVCGVILIWTKR